MFQIDYSDVGSSKAFCRVVMSWTRDFRTNESCNRRTLQFVFRFPSLLRMRCSARASGQGDAALCAVMSSACALRLLLALCAVLLVSASPPRRLSSLDLSELTARLFPPAQLVFATTDAWTSLTLHEREAWTFSNSRLPGDAPLITARAALAAPPSPLYVPVRVVVVDPAGAATAPPSTDLASLARAMRAAGANLTNSVELRFTLELADAAVGQRLEAAAATGDTALRKAVEEVYGAQAAWRDAAVLFVLVGLESGKGWEEGEVRLGRDRLAWAWCRRTERLLEVVSVAEAAATRVFAPPPTHFPVAVPAQLRVDIHPYTPSVSHRALWYASFPWTAFEALARGLAAPGQALGFFSTQTTGECGALCDEAFRDLHAVLDDGAHRAAVVLNGHHVPTNATWSLAGSVGGTGSVGGSVRGGGAAEDAGKDALPEFDVYVLDISRAEDRRDVTEKLADMSPGVFPGIAVLTMDSRKEGAVERLSEQIIAAIAEGVYGVREPELYLSEPTSLVLQDVITRNFIASLLAVHATEARQLLDDLTAHGISVSKALSDRDYADFVQRLNLLLYKQDCARAALSEAGHASAAARFASSARFDVSAMRAKFGLDSRGMPRSEAGFRDPTVRCQFSRVKRSALLLSLRTVEWSGWLVAGASYLTGLGLSRLLLDRYIPGKRGVKRH